MTNRSSALYTAIFKKINSLCPNFQALLKDVTGDAEAAVMKSIKDTYPGANYHICYFHSKKVKFNFKQLCKVTIKYGVLNES